MDPIYDKMRELEAFLEPLVARSDAWLLASTTTAPVDPAEAVVARSLRCMASIKLNSARIKVHRYCAFFDIPVFSRRHCDLKSLGSGGGGVDEEPRRWPTCSCSSTFASAGSVLGSATTPTTRSASATATASTGLSPSSSDGTGGGYHYGQHGVQGISANASITTTTTTTTPPPPQQQQHLQQPALLTTTNFPFSSHQSARICLKSALAIAHCFDELPFPNPTGCCGVTAAAGTASASPPVFLSPTSSIVCPRTMPSFACCAMQCAYALLMVHQKTKTMYPPPPPPPPVVAPPPPGAYGLHGGHHLVVDQAMGGLGLGPGTDSGLLAQQRPLVVDSLVARLQQGLTSICATLSNYATAFEALGGMRGEFFCVFFFFPHSGPCLEAGFSADILFFPLYTDQIQSAIEDSAAFAL